MFGSELMSLHALPGRLFEEQQQAEASRRAFFFFGVLGCCHGFRPQQQIHLMVFHTAQVVWFGVCPCWKPG